MRNKKPTLSIGIPAYNPGLNLVKTLQAIYKATDFRLINSVVVMVDGGDVPPDIRKRIYNRKLVIISKKMRTGQSQRLNDIFRYAKSDYLLIVNDDVLVAKSALSSLFVEIRKHKFDLLCGTVTPLQPKTLVEKILRPSSFLKYQVVKQFNEGKTYLACNGRFMCLSKQLYKKIVIPQSLTNNDAYIYFYTQSSRLKFTYLKKVAAYYRDPQNVNEYYNQVSKFMVSKQENAMYFETNAISYKVPAKYLLRGYQLTMRKSFLIFPFYCLFSLLIRVRVLCTGSSRKFLNSGIWETDPSTKTL